MGLLKNIFGKKHTETAVIVPKNSVDTYIDMLSVHPDIRNLLWLADGQNRNYFHSKKENYFEYDGIRISISFSGSEEPSLMSIKLPIAMVADITVVERPSYYPTYAQLTPQQKGVYWKILENPYNSDIDVGFVFILYYGLERQLLEGDYEKAFDVILKLRDIHQNRSFQSYSACALILTCLFRQRADLAMKFFASLDKEFELNFSDNLYILCKFGLDIPLTGKDIVKMSKTFEFTNTNYIKKYPQIFEENIERLIMDNHGPEGIIIKKYVTTSELKKLHMQSVPVFANMSLRDKSIDVPLISECFKLKKIVYDLLETAHEETKKQLTEIRKTGNITPEVKNKTNTKIVELLILDNVKEKQLLSELKKDSSNAVHKHFAYIALQDFYYKYRDLDEKYLQKCIDYCYEDIKLLPKVQEQHLKDEKDSINKLSIIYRKKEIEEKIANVGYFNGNIPAFKRLAIIYEKRKDFNSSISVCVQAIDYYNKIGMISVANEFNYRKEGLIKKTIKLD